MQILERLQAFLDGNFVPKAHLEASEAKLKDASDKVSALESDLASANTNFLTADGKLKTAEASVSSLTSERDTLKAKIETLEANAKTVDELASAKAREACQAQGIPAANIPANEPGKVETNEQKLDRLRAEMLTEKDPNKKYELGQKCRELRGHADLFTSK